MTALVIRKHADRTVGTRVPRIVDGDQRLVNPETPGDDHEPWPLAGVEIVGGAPARTTLPQKYATVANSEGWLSLVGARPVYRPAAPLNDPAAVPPHVFIHVEKVVIHCISGDVTYRVIKQPDKYADTPGATQDTKVTDEIYDAGATRVDAFYELELES